MIQNEERYTIPHIPSKFDLFQESFVDACQSNAVVWGIPADVINRMLGLQSRWTPARALCANRATTNVVNRTAQAEVLADYVALSDSVMHTYIVGNTAVPAEAKALLGVHALNTSRKRVEAPRTVPELHVDTTGAGAHILRFRDKDATGRFGKPEGVTFCEIRYQVGGTAPAAAEAAPVEVKFSKSGSKIAFTSDQRGQIVYYFGRWVNTRGETGSWSDMATATVH